MTTYTLDFAHFPALGATAIIQRKEIIEDRCAWIVFTTNADGETRSPIHISLNLADATERFRLMCAELEQRRNAA